MYVDGEGRAIAEVRGARVLVLHPDANLLAHLAGDAFMFRVSGLGRFRVGIRGLGCGLEGVVGLGSDLRFRV